MRNDQKPELHDREWEQSVFAGLLALTQQGRAGWKIDRKLHGAMRCEYGGESFWLWRGRLMIEEDMELRVRGPEARELRTIVEAERERQIREWHAAAEQRRADRRASVDRALALVVEAANGES
jgi:hypothetical protein